MSTELNPLVSVCLITYNHSKYINQAIDSVLRQKVNFLWEFIIADDFSTDGTRDILIQYRHKYPNLIRLILQTENVGAHTNWMDLITSPKGKYVAYFEGDDYWTDPLKLQKQIDFLENNPDFAICFHKVYSQVGTKIKLQLSDEPDESKTYTIEDLATGNFIGTQSAVFRNGLIDKFPDWFPKSPIGDYVLHMLNASKGKIYYMPDAMAVYRKNLGSIWYHQPFDTSRQKLIIVTQYLIEEFKQHSIKPILVTQLVKHTIDLYKFYFYSNQPDKAATLLHSKIEFLDNQGKKLMMLELNSFLFNIRHSWRYKIGNSYIKTLDKVSPSWLIKKLSKKR